jgi:hypothetical protein
VAALGRFGRGGVSRCANVPAGGELSSHLATDASCRFGAREHCRRPGPGYDKDFLNFLAIAQGSLNETETLLVIAHRLGYLTEKSLADLLAKLWEVGRILNGLRSGLKNRGSR